MRPEDAARATAKAVVAVPAGFMQDGATYKRGNALGFEGIDFYTAGRGGALGDVEGSVVAAAFVFFNPPVVVDAWERSSSVMPRRQAAEAFLSCLHSWSADHLGADVDYARFAELLGGVIGTALPAAAPLFAAWKGLPEPADPKALALQRLHVLRELRGAVHGAAVVAFGLQPLEAVLVRTPFMAGVLGWPEPYPNVGERREAWAQAEAATNQVLGHAYGALDPGELTEFVDLATAVHKGVD
jgi:hypothetical protein